MVVKKEGKRKGMLYKTIYAIVDIQNTNKVKVCNKFLTILTTRFRHYHDKACKHFPSILCICEYMCGIGVIISYECRVAESRQLCLRRVFFYNAGNTATLIDFMWYNI